MKKTVFRLTTLMLFSIGALINLNAQVTVGGTSVPRATLDVVTIPSYAEAQGVIAPNLALSVLNATHAAYTTAQTGAIVYVNDITGGSTHAKTVKITKIGYYYFDGAIWQGMGGGGELPKPKVITNIFNGAVLLATDFNDVQHVIAINIGPSDTPNLIFPNLTSNDFGKILTLINKGGMAVQASLTGVTQNTGLPTPNFSYPMSATLGPNKSRTFMWLGDMWAEISF